MVKKLLKIVSVFIVIAIIIAGTFLYGIYIAVDRVNLSYQTLSDTKIPESLNNKSIAFISDLKYNGYMDKTRLQKMIEKYNQTGADIVIFGGDMFYDALVNPPDSQSVLDVSELLKSIQAPLGKFAILGDEDQVNEETKNIVSQILYDSDFEVITNATVKLRNDEAVGISLIGLDSLINGDPQPDTAFANISEDSYNILITHCPDLLKRTDINLQYIDTAIAGHSLGGQIYIPIIGPLHRMEGAQNYYHGTYNLSGTSLVVSNGLGTINMDMRLFAPPQILIFRLQHETDIQP